MKYNVLRINKSGSLSPPVIGNDKELAWQPGSTIGDMFIKPASAQGTPVVQTQIPSPLGLTQANTKLYIVLAIFCILSIIFLIAIVAVFYNQSAWC
jgi:hypothetical protein